MALMKVVEFYSGIGGMCMALKEAGIPHEIVQAFDINNIANDVYRHNFPNNKCSNRMIESITGADLKRLNADLWTMSPPCQPFTRLGKRMDTNDKRTNSFLHILRVLPEVLPSMILLENVKGFETSEACKMLLSVLDQQGYKYQCFLCTPLQFGVPNCRLRFYLLARRDGLLSFPLSSEIRLVPINGYPMSNCKCPVCTSKVVSIETPDENFEGYVPYCQQLKEFSNPHSVEEEFIHLALKEKDLKKGFKALDIVSWDHRKSCCFTKRYTQYLDGTGSVLQTSSSDASKSFLDQLKVNEDDPEILMNYAKSLQLRFFSSREIANLMSFPSYFSFPESVTYKQRVRLLGNSINVKVVSHLLFWLLGVQKEIIDEA